MVKKKESCLLLEVVGLAGSITLKDLLSTMELVGGDVGRPDLSKLARYVDDGELMRSSRGGIWWYHLPKVEEEVDLEKIISAMGSKKEFTVGSVAKELGIEKEAASLAVSSLEDAGRVVIVRHGKYMGKKFPWFKVVK